MAVPVDDCPHRLKWRPSSAAAQKSTCEAQDLVCLTQLALLSPQRLDALLFGSGWFWTLAGSTLLLAYQRRNVSGVEPILATIDVLAAHYDS